MIWKCNSCCHLTNAKVSSYSWFWLFVRTRTMAKYKTYSQKQAHQQKSQQKPRTQLKHWKQVKQQQDQVLLWLSFRLVPAWCCICSICSISIYWIFLRRRFQSGLENHRLLHLGLNSGCFHHLRPHLHDSNKLRDPEDMLREMLQVLRWLGEGGQKSGLWKLLLRWWREEAGCDGGNFFISIINHHWTNIYQFICLFQGYWKYDKSKMWT